MQIYTVCVTYRSGHTYLPYVWRYMYVYLLLCSCSSSTFPRTMAGTPKAEASTHTQIFTTCVHNDMTLMVKWSHGKMHLIILMSTS